MIITRLNWLEQVSNSIPDHASEVKSRLLDAFTNSVLDEVDAHACALVAAIASNNGELAFEISMNGPLMGTVEREAAKTAAAVAAVDSVLNFFDDLKLIQRYTSDVAVIPEGVSSVKYAMYTLTAGIVYASPATVKECYRFLTANSVYAPSIIAIAKIAAVVSSINKIAI